MPEIAEVRLIADNIADFLVGHRIAQVQLMQPEVLLKWANRNLKGLSEFNADIENNPPKVVEVHTRGKFCWIQLENEWFIMIAFGMSGNVRVEPTPEYLTEFNKHGKPVTREEYLKHCHLKIHYLHPEKKHFYYHDIRRFGSWTFSRNKQLLNTKLSKLGHDPLGLPALTDSELVSLFRKHDDKNICKILMAQGVIAGVGNYICSEVLYSSRICPLAQIKEIPDDALITMYQAIRSIAQNAYVSGGASLYTYTGMHGDKTEFKDTLQVYGKTIDPLGNQIIRISDKDSPDRRSKFWVAEVQSIGKPIKSDNTND